MSWPRKAASEPVAAPFIRRVPKLRKTSPTPCPPGLLQGRKTSEQVVAATCWVQSQQKAPKKTSREHVTRGRVGILNPKKFEKNGL